MLLYKSILNFNTYLTLSDFKSINFVDRGLKRKQALLGSNLSAIDPSRYTVTDMGLSFLSPFSVWLGLDAVRRYGFRPMAKKTHTECSYPTTFNKRTPLAPQFPVSVVR